MVGSIQANDAQQAMEQLTALGLIVSHIEPRAAAVPSRFAGKALRGEDLLAFNEQLAQLAASGLSLERGLRLMAEDMPGKALRQSIADLANDLEAGDDFEQAMNRRPGQFPVMYGSILRAGVRSGDLPGVLANLGEHLIMVRRLQNALWSAASYPLLILFMLGVVLVFISQVVVPPMRSAFDELKIPLPRVSAIVFEVAAMLPWLAMGLGVLAILGLLRWRGMRMSGQDASWIERWVVPLPLIGPVLRYSRVARWCSALSMGIEAGMDLSLAIRTAGEASGSPGLIGESAMLASVQRDGDRLANAIGVKLIPAAALASIDLAIGNGNLPLALRGLASMYQQQAEYRMSLLRYFLLPAMLLLIGVLVSIAIIALYLPLAAMLNLNP